jgi:uncharacterized coiled-coil DUF342 family protein
MRDQIRSRLDELHAEAAAGERRLRELEAESVQLRATLLRIDGAIVALTELLNADERPESSGEREGPRAVRS